MTFKIGTTGAHVLYINHLHISHYVHSSLYNGEQILFYIIFQYDSYCFIFYLLMFTILNNYILNMLLGHNFFSQTTADFGISILDDCSISRQNYK